MEKKSVGNSQILEALQWQPISEEEKQRRHILGRLYGPIATFGEPTRNGRFYNKELWTKALNDELFLEKIKNKTLLLELEHPDRDTLDAKQACACIPEIPKIVGNDLYAVIDVLDLPNGRILKTLIDYGYVPGISSRGSGDVDADNEVDPETFYLETWDIVSTPAVKKARLNVCESLDTKQAKLRVALKEAYENASEDDKVIMKNKLDDMNIQIEEDVEADEILPGGTPANIDDIPVEPMDDMLVEADETEEVEAEEEVVEEPEEPVEEVETDEEAVEETEETDEEEVSAETFMQITNNLFKLLDDIMTDDNKDAIQDSIEKMLDEIDLPEETWEAIGVVIEDEDGVKQDPEEDDAEDKEADDSDDEKDAEKADDETEEAVDDGDEEVIESFKDLVRQKDLLESEVKSLKAEKTVSDAKVEELQESLDKYKAAFARTSELAAQAMNLKAENAKLNESLSTVNTKNAELEQKLATKSKLVESVDNNAKKVKALTEKLNVMSTELESSKKQAAAKLAEANQVAQKRTELAKKYKNGYLQVIERYVSSKAQMLGVKPAEITSRLNESYTLDDVDAVCETILHESVRVNQLPFGNSKKVRINESKVSKKTISYDPADDGCIPLDDSLLELAGLK